MFAVPIGFDQTGRARCASKPILRGTHKMVNAFTESTCHLSVLPGRCPGGCAAHIAAARGAAQPRVPHSCPRGVRAQPQAGSRHKPTPSSPWAVICGMLQSLQSRASLSPSTLEAMKFKCRFVFEITQGQAESRAAEVPEHCLDPRRLRPAGTPGHTRPSLAQAGAPTAGRTPRRLLEISK